MTPRPESLIDLDRYPIHGPRQGIGAVVAAVQAALGADGCAVLPGFLSDQGLAALAAEAEDRRGDAHYAARKHNNAYLNDGDPSRPAHHPINRLMPRTNGFVRADSFDATTAAYRLYHWPPLMHFIAACLDRDELFIYDDPVSNMIVNVMGPGEEFNWHFDTNEFTITMLLRPAEVGGHFEYVSGLRSPDEERFDDVAAVLDGDRSRVRRLSLSAGDLQLFLGRFSLHRVTPNQGSSHRLLLIMSFAERPGMVGSVERVSSLYGRVTEAHQEHARLRADSLND